LVSFIVALVKSAVVMANELRAEATSYLPEAARWRAPPPLMRPRYSQIYALCERESLARALALSWAITPFVVPFDLFEPQNTIETAVKFLVNHGRLRQGSTVVIIGIITAGEEIVDAEQMRII
jgi:pyruvate kinase